MRELPRAQVCAFILLIAGVAAAAEPVLLVHDGRGALLRTAPAVLRREGLALVEREALYGAESAVLFAEGHGLYPVVYLTAEDRDSGVVQLFVGRQAPAGPDRAVQAVVLGESGGHKVEAGEYKEMGGFGAVARLDCTAKGEASGPLYNEYGFLAGWHAVRVVDGQRIAFAIPLNRIEEGLKPMAPVSVGEWNRHRPAVADEGYTKAMAYTWVGDWEGAAYYWRKASEAEPANARVWFQLAFMEGKTGHSAAKIASFRKAIELQPEYAEPHYHLAIALVLAGDRGGAVKEAEALRRLDERLSRRLDGFLDIAHADRVPAGIPARP